MLLKLTHQNCNIELYAVLDFMNEEAIDNAWIVASYLSDVDCFLASLGGLVTRNYEAENVVQSSAASVAVRGVLFGNTHPLSSRYSFTFLSCLFFSLVH